MAYYDFLEKLRDEELIKFKRCVRKLLDSTFIVADKDPLLFDYLSYSSNRVDISSYLKIMGYDIVVDDEFKYAMLIQSESDTETVGLKKISHVNFSNNEVLTLLVLWMLFLERFGKAEETYIEFGDIVDMQKQYAISMSPNELKNALKTFKRFSLINYIEADMKSDTVVTLYPTLQFAMDKEQFLSVVKEMTAELGKTEYEEDTDNEEDFG
ncbi:DUF4194 domain-containing protein [Solobacterium moorei]|uniref:DUF4194 domain-containing protein n=1 Tax=Solobacterium moorei TaxID=102148 RepID=UPI0023F3E471|nr:DUF4194 domain-containing protein [Solobacterium moorei]